MKRLFLIFLLLSFFSLFSACGQKGALYLPKKDPAKESSY